ncbi:MAG: 30S ribosome-binding factor RbfA [Candidatus Methylomirabilis oxyfera]|nr:30S ribosome-binding factor RbfA [Candidatus Methylomirabilis oxyfera]
MQGKRVDRIGALIQEEISRLILRSVKDPRIGFVTVTRVRVSDDLRQAKIYISLAQAGDAERREALMGLKSAAGFLRGELGRRLSLRYAPALLFFLDDSLEEGLHLAALFRRIESEKRTEE